MRNFFLRATLSLAFPGLVLLAMNPQLAVTLQEKLGLSSETTSSDAITGNEIADVKEIPDEAEIDGDLGPADVASSETLSVPTPRLKPAIPAISAPPAVVAAAPAAQDTAEPDVGNLPRLPGYEKIAKYDDWIGETPCETDIFDPPKTLPGLGVYKEGGLFTGTLNSLNDEIITNRPSYLYESPSGITLQFVKPVIKYYTVTGRNFREMQKLLIVNRPLETTDSPTSSADTSGNSRNVTTFAHIASPTLLDYSMYGRGDRYSVVTDEIVVTMGSVVTLPYWETYETASKRDKAKWDDLFCNAAHHELGHMRIRLNLLAETLEGFAAIPKGKSTADLKQLTEAYRSEVDELIDARQEAYHIYNGGGLRKGMTELPYAQLPFPWLEN